MKKVTISLFVLLYSLSLVAQFPEFVVQMGVSNYVGDLSNNSRSLYMKESNFAGGVFLRYNFHPMLNFRLQGSYARVSGSDANSPHAAIQTRNLSFRSHIAEVALLAEFNFPGYNPYAFKQPLSPYLFGGVAMTHFNPQASYEDRWVALQPLGTEGQGMPNFDAPYRRTVISIPFGIGLKYALTDQINLGLELGARFLFTDFLDDVSGSYVNSAELLAGNGVLAASLAKASITLAYPFIWSLALLSSNNLYSIILTSSYLNNKALFQSL
jgi:opacity protein-like surface antigen